MKLLELEREMSELQKQKQAVEAEYKKQLSVLQNRIMYVESKIQAETEGIDTNIIEKAKEVFYFENAKSIEGGETSAALLSLKKDIVNDDCALLREQYIGCKNYDGFYKQSISCAYGMGPRHGYVVWSIGIQDRGNAEVKNEHKEAMLYIIALLNDKNKRDMVMSIL